MKVDAEAIPDETPFPATLEPEEGIEAREQEEAEAEAEAKTERKRRKVERKRRKADKAERKAERKAKAEAEAEAKVRVCKACHATTTQLDANQCPMCGNPFT